MGRTITVRRQPTTGLESGYAEAAARGIGIEPGAHPEFDSTPNSATHPQVGHGFKLGTAISNAFRRVTGQRESTPAEEESYKLRGQKAYYDAKISGNYLKGS